ncbi:MAG TPA: UDP-N-acetylenolpyruvoylglucosamine reductase, partial [Burkholderiaceae bacterium]|nr:UDP-N-acetylenolpyruvoylglucosamine reductase [Burkholderiaceae bacterium]
RVREFDANDCGFAYRDSFFKAAAGRDWLILAVRLRLARRAALVLDYGELRSELAARGLAQPTPRDVADAVMTIRQRKLPDPARLGNAGSFFKNPTVVQAQADALRDRFAQLPIHRSGAAERGLCKLSAAWMIEQCGWKGHRDGDAGVYSRHALVLVNHGNASGRQLLTLARRIADSVQQRFGIALEPEPIIVGDRWRPGLDER